jgi:hypothetical protein
MPQKTQELVMKYYYSWQARDLDAMTQCLDQKVIFDAGIIKFGDLKGLLEFTRVSPKWTKVTLRHALYNQNEAALFYDAVNEDETMMRVGEYIQIVGNKIAKINVVFQVV